MFANFSIPTPPREPMPPAPSKVAVLIVAHEPDLDFEYLVERLVESEVPAILVVDDGTASERGLMFERISLQPTVHLLRHAKCEGNGAALKTGFEYFLEHLWHYEGLVTTDASGGVGRADDVLCVARALHRAPHLAILGARSLVRPIGLRDGRFMGWREHWGNRIMTFLFRSLTGVPVQDTQSGLRGLPTGLLPRLTALPGQRYDYEMAMLMHIVRCGYPLAEQSVVAVSHEGRGRQAFQPVRDSLRVLRAMWTAPTVTMFRPDLDDNEDIFPPYEKPSKPAKAAK